MADFLSRLVERSAGMATVVRPAVAPLFAPGPVMAAEPTPLGTESVGAVPQGPAPATAAIPRTPAPGLRDAPAVDLGGPGRVPAPARPGVPPIPPGDTASGALRPAAAAPPEAHRRRTVHEDRPPPPEEIPPSGFPVPPGAQGTTVMPRRLPVQEERPGGEAEIGSVATPLLRPREERAPRWAADLPPRGSGEGSPAPIVRISIGRIEVRAVAPSGPGAPRPAPAPKSTGPSLEEYLRPRSRGG